MRRILLLLTCLPFAAVALPDAGLSPPSQVKARARLPTAKLGEPFDVEVVITHDPSQRYELPSFESTGAFELLDQQRQRVDGASSTTTTFVLKLMAFELGKLKTPELRFDVSSVDGQGRLPVSGVDIEVVGTIPPEAAKNGTDLFDVRPPEMVAVRTWRLLIGLAALLAAGALAWFIVRTLRHRRLSPKPIAADPLKPLETRTREALTALQKQDLPAKGRTREFYFRLSEIVRSYLGERYRFDAMECTTPELVATLRTLHTPGLPLHQLTTFANESDFVRYAKATPAAATCTEAIELAFGIVTATTLAASPAAPPKAAS